MTTYAIGTYVNILSNGIMGDTVIPSVGDVRKDTVYGETSSLTGTLIPATIYVTGETTAFEEYIAALMTKLSNSTVATDSDNITLGETVDLAGKKSDEFPRLEVLITKIKCNGYNAQRKMSWSLRYSIMGWIHTDSDSEYPTLAEIKAITSFAKETLDLNYTFLDDKQLGNPACTGFGKLGDYPEIFIEKELIPRTIAFLCDVEAHIYISDTEAVT